MHKWRGIPRKSNHFEAKNKTLTKYHVYDSMKLGILAECNAMHLDFCALLGPKKFQHSGIWHIPV